MERSVNTIWPMRRWQLFEFEDQAWLPAFLRDSVTDILRYYLSTAQPYAPAAACLRTLLMATGCTSIVDFGSGAGGPLGVGHLVDGACGRGQDREPTRVVEQGADGRVDDGLPLRLSSSGDRKSTRLNSSH